MLVPLRVVAPSRREGGGDNVAEGDLQEEAMAADVYSNHVALRVTPYDVLLTFGLQSSKGSTEIVNVYMSPQHARSLAILLDRYLKHYEEMSGPISLPADLVARLQGDTNNENGEDEA